VRGAQKISRLIFFGVVKHTVVPKRFKHVEEYLKEQGRFTHLFKPVRQEAALNKIQEGVNEYWNRHKLLL
jgi:pyruvate ferredoxin oxidoreductase beta subunit